MSIFSPYKSVYDTIKYRQKGSCESEPFFISQVCIVTRLYYLQFLKSDSSKNRVLSPHEMYELV